MKQQKRSTTNRVMPELVARLGDPLFRSIGYILLFVSTFLVSFKVSNFNLHEMARKSMVVNTLKLHDSAWMLHVYALQISVSFISLCIVASKFVACGTPLHYLLKENTDLTHHCAVITGGTTGIGREIALQLLKWNCRVIITGRDKTKGANAVEYLRKGAKVSFNMIQYVEMDLNDLGSVKYAAEIIVKSTPSIDFLINNAGIAGKVYMNAHKREAMFATNFLGHFYLTKLLLPTLISDKARIINMSSIAHYHYDPAEDSILKSGKTLSLPKGAPEKKYYGRSKLYNIWHTQALQRKFDRLPSEQRGAISLSCAPGIVDTYLLDKYAAGALPSYVSSIVKWFTKRPADGANTALYLCAAPLEELVPGAYYYECKLGYVSKHAQDIEKQESLYALAEKMCES